MSILEAGEDGRFAFSLLSSFLSLDSPLYLHLHQPEQRDSDHFLMKICIKMAQGHLERLHVHTWYAAARRQNRPWRLHSALVVRIEEFSLDRSIFHPQTVNIYGPQCALFSCSIFCSIFRHRVTTERMHYMSNVTPPPSCNLQRAQRSLRRNIQVFISRWLTARHTMEQKMFLRSLTFPSIPAWYRSEPSTPWTLFRPINQL